MLQSIRDNTQGWIAGVIISMLILSFALWGIHSYIGGSATNDVIARVNGQEIVKGQVSLAYERMKRQLQSQMNVAQLPIQAEATVKERALQSLIETQALKQASIDKDYRISTTQLDSFLATMPEFQVDGKFSNTKFRQLLEANLYNPGDFLELIKTGLLIDQPRLGIMLTSFSLPDEVTMITSLLNQERDIQYAIVPVELINALPIKISDANVKSYYDEHQDSFKTPEQLNVDYVQLTLNDVSKNIQPTEDALRKYYTETSGSYSSTAANSTKKETTKTPAVIPSFEQVKDKVKKAYIQQQAEEKFGELREKLANITYEHPESLEAAANQLGLKIETSSTFTKDQGGKDISSNPKIRDVAFSDEVLAHHNNSDVIQLNGETAVVLRVKTHSPATIRSLETVKPQIVEQLKAAERTVKTQQLADEIRQKLASGTKSEQVTSDYHLTWNNTGFINRQTSNIDAAIRGTAFSMPKPTKDKASFAITKTPSTYAILILKEVREGSISPQKDKQLSAEQVQNAQGMLEYEFYKNSLIKDAKITFES